MTRYAFLLLLLLIPAAARADNPFGLTLWPAPGQTLAMTAARAAALGVAWYQPPTLYVDRWRGRGGCTDCRAPTKLGLRLAITVRNGGSERAPSSPPQDLTAYRATLDAMLAEWQPALLVVEDEEDQPQNFRASPSPDGSDSRLERYRGELDSACQAAHSNRAWCSNGGLSFAAAAAITWMSLLEAGKSELACTYAKRSLAEAILSVDGAALCGYRQIGQVPAALRAELLHHADLLLPIYRDSAIDAVNFHWFGSDAVGLAQTIDALARLAGKPAISNRLGQPPTRSDPRLVRPLLRAAFAGHVPVAIWYSVDGQGSVSLFDRDGRLRPTGAEFLHQMSGLK